jgi:hypothetical protein
VPGPRKDRQRTALPILDSINRLILGERRQRTIHQSDGNQRKGTTMLKTLAVAGTLGVLASFAVAVPPANAALGDCTTEIGDNYVSVNCGGSWPTMFRAWVDCTNGHEYFGPWFTAGTNKASGALCPTNQFVVQGGVDHKNLPVGD